jgi:ADP-heptose:LPS heptosyltransferase
MSASVSSARFDPPIERIAVFRPSTLGGVLCAMPALRALRQGFPDARITLVGLPWAHGLARRFDCIDAFVEFPGFPGLGATEADVRALPDFLAQMQAARFDLALQMHGQDEVANAVVAAFGARHQAGYAATQGWRPATDAAHYIAWPERGHESERLLALTDHLGLARCGTGLEFPLDAADRAEAAELLAAHATAHLPYVCMHVGAPLPSRRWDVRRFAEVADTLAARGRAVVLTGAAEDAGLVHDVEACMRHAPVNLCGRTSLWTLGALIEGAETVICSDAGISHVAAALGRPSVVVSCGYDVERWAPPDTERHRVVAHPVACRPCKHRTCPHDHECANGVGPVHVLRQLPPTSCARRRAS